MIKIDSEGYEKEVLIGMNDYLKQNINIILENTQTSFEFAKTFLEGYGYKCYRYQNGSFTNQKLKEALNLYFLK